MKYQSRHKSGAGTMIGIALSMVAVVVLGIGVIAMAEASDETDHMDNRGVYNESTL